MKTHTRKICWAFLIVFGLLGTSLHPMAMSSNQESWSLNAVRAIDPDFLSGEETAIESEKTTTLISPFGEALMVEYRSGRSTVGYSIFIGDVLVEFAESHSPYEDVECDADSVFYYDFCNYTTVTQEKANQMLLNKQPLIQKEETRGMMENSSLILSGVTHNLQGGYNCIATALSNVIWYWGNHGYSVMISGQTFSTLNSEIQMLFNGNYANNSVPSVANSYISYHGCNYFTTAVYWNPQFWRVIDEIEAGSPCMVGFAAGSTQYSYSMTVGHMTMCYGYIVQSNLKYVVLADGHSSSSVTKLWTTYNDCVIKLRQ